ncbi:MAG: response regulator [Candidatus Baltobacteraceae bacterium]
MASVITAQAPRNQRRFALFAVLAMILAALGTLPVARVPAPHFESIFEFIMWGAVFNQLATAYLLSRHLRASRIAALGVLTAAYICTALLTLGYIAAFPSQAAVVLGISWHYVFPLTVIAYVLSRRRSGTISAEAAATLSLRVPLIAATLTLLAVSAVLYESGSIPMLQVAGDYSRIVSSGAAPLAALTTLAALIILWRRTQGGTTMHLWLAVSLVALLLDLMMTMYSLHFFTWGWYLARVCGLFAGSYVFLAMMEEAGRLSTSIVDAERKLHVVFDSVADAILTIDVRGVIASCNHAAAMLFDISEERLTRMPVSRIVPDYIVAMDSLPKSGTIEVRGQRSDGSIFPLEIAASQAVEEASMTILIARDITSRKRAEAALASARDQALEAARLKAQFLATMSHEIRTPINAIVGMSELLLSTSMTEEQREYANTVNTSAESLLAVINDILDFSKLEAGKMELDSIPFSPLAIVEAMADILASQARRKGLSLVTYVAADVPKAVAGDPNRLKQVLLNLMSNAVKFTESGNVVARCMVEQRAGEAVVLRFSVTDSGIGIEKAQRERLFMPFSQADGSTSRRFGGTGLGLSIAKRLVTMMEGIIGVDSAAGKGSTFYFTAKFAQLSDDLAPSTDQPQIIAGSSALLVDDDKVSRDILMQYLASWGIAVDVAKDAAEALDLLLHAEENQTEYTFAIIDYFMPNVDGIELGRRIHKLAEYEGMPLILVTAFDEAGRGKDAVDAGFAGYLRKPMRQSALYDAIAVATQLQTLPRHPKVAAAPVAAVNAHTTTRILLAEDHAVNQMLAMKQLAKLGYEAVACSDGQQAIDELAKNDYDIVLMDCQMPVVDGFEATRVIRRNETQTGKHVPIVAMTANAMEGDREMCLAAGMDDYIAKPVQMHTLRTVLERWTPEREAERR